MTVAKKSYLLSSELLAALADLAGIEAGMIRRIVIDIQAGDVPMIHIERFGDDKLLRVVRALDGIQITTSDTKTEEEGDGRQE